MNFGGISGMSLIFRAAGQHKSFDTGPADVGLSRNTEQLPVFHPEFGRFMLEATPGKPWGIGFKDLLDVEPNMRWRSVSLFLILTDSGTDSHEKPENR
jgi:hypothetical protein